MEDNERGSKRTRVARLSMQERRSSVSNLASSGAITWLDRGLARIEPMAQECHNGGVFASVCSFDKAAEDVPEDEDDPYGITMASECPSAVHVGPEKEPEAAIFPKPLLPVKPPIWAESRQEVCESLDSFRSFQGGVYHIHDVAKGYLLGGHSSSRDIFHHGGRLIISHGGGKAEALHSRNRCLEVRGPGDQLEDDRSVRALLNNYECRRPLVLLADDNYRLFPFDLTARGYTYVVLGLYWITHAWAERQQVNRDHDVVRYKFVFQWCQGQGDPWWLQDTEHVSTTTQAEVIPVHEGQSNDVSYVGQSVSQSPRLEMTIHDCRHCRMGSRVKASAPAAGDSLPSSLLYSTELLRLLPANHLPVSAASFFPVSPSKISTAPRPFAKGMHCQACGRLSTRFKWQSFECSNNHCKRTYDVPKFRFSHKDFWLQEQTLKFFQQRIAEDSGIVVRELEFQAKTDGSALPYVQKFELPHDRGHIFLIPGHPSINKVANRLFYEYQDQANEGKFQFRRWPLRAHKCRSLISQCAV
ncbi:hypothetical protein EI94DRAFT_364661 [Lactarius quietus]|nr:hypothetical protein EI94DRAFT_364661 [Lactarius quietus]